MGLKFSNFATSTIADVGGIAAGDLALNVAAGDGALFPSLSAGEYFYAVLTDTSANREVIKVTARSTDTFTIVRAQDGTTAAAFSQGDSVELRLVKSVMDELAGSITSLTSHLASEYHFAAATVMLFAQSSAPTGWTRNALWTDGSMICYAASGDIGTGGSTDPRTHHNHTGPSHTHTGPSHTHTVPAHAHSGGTLSGDVTLTDPSGPGAWQAAGTLYGNTSTTVSVTMSSGTTANSSVLTSGAEGTGATGASGTGVTGYNVAPYYLTVIAATKDAY